MLIMSSTEHNLHGISSGIKIFHPLHDLSCNIHLLYIIHIDITNARLSRKKYPKYLIEESMMDNELNLRPYDKDLITQSFLVEKGVDQ